MIVERSPLGLPFSEPAAGACAPAAGPRPRPAGLALFQQPEPDLPEPRAAHQVDGGFALSFSAPDAPEGSDAPDVIDL
ncbi:hypothetical protein [Kitasatospora sp. NPDC094015]|uniref:hypothetical protein n=1 Tax=Kitasatospora sp. NPDC094015 TaxID=3155205 RepID=UPI00332C341C